MNTTHSIVWLHLSDLHLCEQQTGWDCHRVLEPLRKDLQEMESEHGLKPDLIFFTGDAAFGNLSTSSMTDQYGQVAQFLDSVRKAFSVEVPKQNVFLVPGNHDVDRQEVTQQQTEWLRNPARTASEITKLIQTGNREWKAYAARLHAYRGFLETHGYGHLLQDPERLLYAAVREV
jgi:predicted MPP superfamily phosphohydrolase